MQNPKGLNLQYGRGNALTLRTFFYFPDDVRDCFAVAALYLFFNGSRESAICYRFFILLNGASDCFAVAHFFYLSFKKMLTDFIFEIRMINY